MIKIIETKGNNLILADSFESVLCPYGSLRIGETVGPNGCSVNCAAFQIQHGRAVCNAGNFEIGVFKESQK